MTTAPPPQENAGLTSLVETIVAPASAFDRLAEKQTWGWAFIASSLLTIVAALASAPVNRHLAKLITAQRIAAISNPRQAAAARSAAAISLKFAPFGWVFSPIGILVVVLIATVILVIFNAVLGGKANFKQIWCAAMNVSVVFSLGVLIGSILLALRGPDAIASVTDLYRNSLSLAAVFPRENIKFDEFLLAITPFSLWGLWLNSMLMQRIARLEAPKAWAAALAVLILPALLTAGLAVQPPAAPGGTPPATSASATP